ncbi:hypothetical protein V1517DRAFT_292241 [Lipomyces orientalis]|uniref:Uncharacterized protein n=1 Tax=Lipomyces orientalis TaxID=1233043 RepID=A0ACC3TMI2_9ASCO
MFAHSKSSDLQCLADACEIAMPNLALRRPQSFLQLTKTTIYTPSGQLLDGAIEYELAKDQARFLCGLYYQASRAPKFSSSELERTITPIFRNRLNHAQLALKGDDTYHRERISKVFEIRSHPSLHEMDMLSSICGLEYHQVKVWFANRRTRSKISKRPRKKKARLIS